MKKNRGLRIAVILMFGCILAAGFVYGLLTWYYREEFTVNTWINHVYCTGKSIEEVNSELLSMTKAPSVAIKDIDGKIWELDLADVGYTMDYKSALIRYLDMQQPWRWGEKLFKVSKSIILPVYTYDEAKLLAYWDSLPFVKAEKEAERVVEIVWTENGYTLINTLGPKLDFEKGYDLLKATVESAVNKVQICSVDMAAVDINGTNIVSANNARVDMTARNSVTLEINLVAEGAYEELLPDASQQAVLEQWQKVDEFQNLKLVYDMGDEQVWMKPAELGSFLVRTQDGAFEEDESGKLCISKTEVESFTNTLADAYDTYGKERSFYATRGEWVTIPAKGTYGTLIDRKAEFTYLYEALTERISEVHTPEYKREAYHRGLNDIGNTYIEIDMTEQKMYFYLAGELKVETDVVTGNLKRKWGTPEGVNYIYAMQRKRTLRGPGYASFVNYWMPVKGGIGIHDANWRKKFGGEIYKTDGSHGCINTPYEDMKIIYENVEIGVPVVMFY